LILYVKYTLPKPEPKYFDDSTKHSRTCNFCSCDIFNACFHCPECKNEVDYCLSCIAEGRGCDHKSNLELMQYIPTKQVLNGVKRAQAAFENLKKNLGNSLERFVGNKIKGVQTLVYNKILPERGGLLPIGLVAHYRVTYYKQANNLTNCHQCKRKKPLCYIAYCTKCTCKYCEFCLWNRSHIKIKVETCCVFILMV
jgi:hypothetical protein